MEYKPQHRQTIRRIMEESITEALVNHQLDQLSSAEEGELQDQPYVSIIGFRSDKMSGTMVLGCSASFLQRTCPGLSHAEKNIQPYLFDWVGELSNLIMGRIKNKLLSYGLVLKINPPSVSEADTTLFSSYSARHPSETLWLKTNQSDTLCLLVSSDIEESVNLEQPSGSVGLSPGTGIISLKDQGSKGLKNEQGLGKSKSASKEETETAKTGDVDITDDLLDDIDEADFLEDINILDDTEDEFDKSAEDDELGDFQLAEDGFEEESFGQRKYNNLPDLSKVSDKLEAEYQSSHQSLSKKKPVSEFVLTSVRYLDNGYIEISFNWELVYQFHLETLYNNEMREFEIQGHTVTLSNEGLGLQLSIEGVNVTVYREGDAA